MSIRRVCVYCGSSAGSQPAFWEAAQSLGRALAARNWELVYGGASVGLMGAVADAVVASGGRATGVIPRRFDSPEVAHSGLTALHVVADMPARKALMMELSDAFIALPGGIGTLEELFEVWSWRQLAIHYKPIGLFDVNGYYGPLLSFLDGAVSYGFLRPQHRELAVVGTDADMLLDRLSADAKRHGDHGTA